MAKDVLYECENCENTFPEDEINNFLCKNCRREKNTRRYKNLAFALLIICFVIGIICGFYFKKLTINSDGLYYDTLNWTIIFYFWIGGITLFSIYMPIYSICHRLDLFINKNN